MQVTSRKRRRSQLETFVVGSPESNGIDMTKQVSDDSSDDSSSGELSDDEILDEKERKKLEAKKRKESEKYLQDKAERDTKITERMKIQCLTYSKDDLLALFGNLPAVQAKFKIKS